MKLTGGCLCKAVRFRIAEAPVTARACWCRMCQTIGGRSGMVNALFNTAALTVDGDLEEFKFIADSEHTADSPTTLSGMRPVYTKPAARGRKRRPGRKRGHPGVRRRPPDRIDHYEEHRLSECPH